MKVPTPGDCLMQFLKEWVLFWIGDSRDKAQKKRQGQMGYFAWNTKWANNPFVGTLA